MTGSPAGLSLADPLGGSDPKGLAKKNKGFWLVPCDPEEQSQCIEHCERQGKIMRSCMVTMGWTPKNVAGEWIKLPRKVPGSMSCDCYDPFDPEPLPTPAPGGGATCNDDCQKRLQENSKRAALGGATGVILVCLAWVLGG